MFNPTVIAMLEKSGVITHEAGEALAKELVDKIHPARYDDALRLVEAALEKVKTVKAEPWAGDIAILQQKVAALEKQLASKEGAKKVANLKVG
jgi:hypothetical protein